MATHVPKMFTVNGSDITTALQHLPKNHVNVNEAIALHHQLLTERVGEGRQALRGVISGFESGNIRQVRMPDSLFETIRSSFSDANTRTSAISNSGLATIALLVQSPLGKDEIKERLPVRDIVPQGARSRQTPEFSLEQLHDRWAENIVAARDRDNERPDLIIPRQGAENIITSSRDYNPWEQWNLPAYNNPWDPYNSRHGYDSSANPLRPPAGSSAAGPPSTAVSSYQTVTIAPQPSTGESSYDQPGYTPAVPPPQTPGFPYALAPVPAYGTAERPGTFDSSDPRTMRPEGYQQQSDPLPDSTMLPPGATYYDSRDPWSAPGGSYGTGRTSRGVREGSSSPPLQRGRAAPSSGSIPRGMPRPPGRDGRGRAG